MAVVAGADDVTDDADDDGTEDDDTTGAGGGGTAVWPAQPMSSKTDVLTRPLANTDAFMRRGGR